MSRTADATLNDSLLTLTASAAGLTADETPSDRLDDLLDAAAATTAPPPRTDTGDERDDGLAEVPDATPSVVPPRFDTPVIVSPIAFPAASARGMVGYTEINDINGMMLDDPYQLGLTLEPVKTLTDGAGGD
jgi:hypothetical protein